MALWTFLDKNVPFFAETVRPAFQAACRTAQGTLVELLGEKSAIANDICRFVDGAWLTVELTVISVLAGLALALPVALARLSRNLLLKWPAFGFMFYFRGTPLLVQIFLIYMGLPQLGWVPTAIPSGILALSLNYGAYLSEIFRAGILSVPAGQHEAAQALGLHRWLIMWKIVLPQAMRVIIPPTGTQFIAMLKDSSLVSVMGLWEIMFLAQSYGRSTYRYIEMLITAAVIYWVLSITFEIVQARLERHYGKGFKAR